MLVWYSADRDPLRVARLRGPRRGPRHARRPRQDRRRRLRPDPPRHVRRRPPGVGLRGEPLRRPVRRRAGRGHGATSGERLRRRSRCAARAPTSAPTSSSSRRGALTDYGYEVEIRIPFKSLRYQPGAVQTWGSTSSAGCSARARRTVGAGPARGRLVPRAVRHLVGLTDLRRGLVLDLNPVASPRRPTGAPDGQSGWHYDGRPPRARRQRALGHHQQPDAQRHGQSRLLAGRVRRGPVPVRSAAGAVLPREAAVLPRRHRAVHHAEQADLHPAHRRSRWPRASSRARAAGTNIALLSAVDDPAVSADRPAITRCSTCCACSATSARVAGSAWSTPIAIVGSDFNRVGGLDARLLFGELYSVKLQLAGSHTRTTGRHDHGAALVRPRRAKRPDVRLPCTGQRQRPRLSRPERLLPAAGIVARQLRPAGDPVRSRRAASSKALRATSTSTVFYRYGQFATTAGMQEEKIHLNTNVRLRGGWTAGASLLVEQFGYPSEVYVDYRIELPRADGTGADTVPFVGQPQIPNRDYVLQVETRNSPSSRATRSSSGATTRTSSSGPSADLLLFNAGLDWRPSDQLRFSGTYQLQRVGRRPDGSTVNIQHIPRLKVEYRSPARSFSGSSASTPASARTTSATTPAPRPRSSSSIPRSTTSSARRRSPTNRFAGTYCSPTSRIPAPYSSPATAVPCATRSTPTIRCAPVSTGRTTDSSSR